MKKTVLSFGFAAAAMFVWIATSWAYTINDNYIGAAPTHASYWGADVVGRDCFFDVDRMEVNYSQGEMTVDIYSRYFNNIGRYGTEMGDLFISTDGWSPVSPTWIDQWNGVSEFGFHWGLTCGNDVIEGSAPAPVPEPGTMLLLGCGLVCLAGFGGKRFRKK